MGLLSKLRTLAGLKPDQATPDGVDGAGVSSRRERRVPTGVQRYHIPEAVIEETQRFLRSHGANGHEAYMLWAGGFSEHEAYVTTCVEPEVPTRPGGVKIPTRKMTQINRALLERDQLLVAQVHSHPGQAFHSNVDERKAVTFHEGFVSIVVPDYASTSVADLQACGVYRYHIGQGWRQLTAEETDDMFVIEPTSLEV